MKKMYRLSNILSLLLIVLFALSGIKKLCYMFNNNNFQNSVYTINHNKLSGERAIKSMALDSSEIWNDEIIQKEQEKQNEENRKNTTKVVAITTIIVCTGLLVFNIYRIITKQEQKRRNNSYRKQD